MRPGNRRLSIVVPGAIVAGVCIVGGVTGLMSGGRPLQAVGAFACPVVFYVLITALSRKVRLEITESVVLARQGGFRGHPDLEVPRDDVRVIHYFPRTIAFHGADNKPLIRIDPNYTVRQMRSVARLLGVPLYDHRRWLVQEVRIGRRVYDPAAPDRAS